MIQLISLVIPVFNEDANLDNLIFRCLMVCDKMQRNYEIILVDDGSRDSSPLKIAHAAEKNPNKIIGVFLNRNYGQHAAVMAGFAEAKGDAIITLDADLQNPPEEIPKLVEQLDAGFEVVGSIRINRQDSLFRRLSSKLVNTMVRQATGVNMHDYGCMLRGYQRHVIEAVLQCHERSTFIPVLANSFAHKTTEVQVEHAARTDGDSKYSLWKLINLQFDLLTSITTLPLRLLTVMGAISAFLGMGFGAFLLIMRFVYGAEWAVRGVFTLFSVQFFFIGLQFMAMGLMGEYLGRIYYDVRARPRYFVKAVVGRIE
jgi:undecaprenyl-phosphate 4-deoxy-4-formamido-L-arabinose transferase